MSPWLLIPLACLAFGLAREYRLYRQHLADANERLRGVRQERVAGLTLRPRTGDVQAAPRLVPLADVVPFPGRDDRPAA